MTLRRRLLDYGIVLLLIAIPAVTLRANLRDPGQLNAFDQAVLRLSSPLQDAASWVIEGLGGVWDRYVWRGDVAEENDELRAEIRRVREENALLRQRVANAAVLEELVGLRRETPAQTVGARVVASSVNPYFRVDRIAIDRGEATDVAIATDMPVLNADGLVGRVQRTYGDYSDVLLATDPKSSVDVLIPRTGGRGVLTGLGSRDSYRCKIEYLERGAEIKVRDQVVTSGLGGAFPADVPVGTIARVTTKEYGLYQEVEVEPAVDFSNLGALLVVLAPPPPPDPNADKPRPSTPAYSVRPFQ